MAVKTLDKRRFDAFVAHTRRPELQYFAHEFEWLSSEDEKVIGALILDKVDGDFSAVVLGRDEGKRYRAIDIITSIETDNEARNWLESAIEKYSLAPESEFFQGDRGVGVDLFSPIVAENKLHPYFVALNSESAFLSAKSIINEIMPHYIDIDGNFVEQFQTTGFDSRLWELYINSYLTEEELSIDRSKNAPDFMVSGYGHKAAIECVIVGRKAGAEFVINQPPRIPDPSPERDEAVAIRFGSPLYSKLKKKYWELPHVSGGPLIFAIADFHENQSMTWSLSSSSKKKWT
jgi:hypothetical protein